ncbi:RING-type domain-containing protein [Entamoeba marina]
MGICHECKKQTHLYCVHHKKHTCIECVMKNHSTCTICEYRDHVENNREEINECGVCKEPLNDSQTVRLPCLCVFHLQCLIDQFEDTFEELKCPRCSSVIFDTTTDIPSCLKQALINAFAGKSYIRPFVESNVVSEEIDAVTQAILNDPQDSQTQEVEQAEHHEGDNARTDGNEELVEYTDQVVTSLKSKREKSQIEHYGQQEQHTDAVPNIEFDVESDEEVDASVGMDFVKTVGKKKKITWKTVFILLFVLLLLILFIGILYIIGDVDT